MRNSQGHSEVADDARPGLHVEIATEATVQWLKELILADSKNCLKCFIITFLLLSY
jgi:hypothetical protein